MFDACRTLSKSMCAFGCVVLLSAAGASAQAVTDQPSHPNPVNAPIASGWSSSQTGTVEIADGAVPAANPAALPSAPAPAASPRQDDNTSYSGWKGSDLMHRLTIEAGVGAAAPAGDKADITWGWGLTMGGGVNITQNLAALVEYQYLDPKIPGAVIAESGAQGGRYHIWSFTLDPVYDFLPKAANDFYVVGGGGFYRKVMNFTNPSQSCGFFYYYYTCGTSNQTVGHISSNQGGFNFGGGYQHRFGGMYGLSRARLFAEVRYLDVLSPAIKSKSANGLQPVSISKDTKLLPIMLGIRW
jgi:hypothetical protein